MRRAVHTAPPATPPPRHQQHHGRPSALPDRHERAPFLKLNTTACGTYGVSSGAGGGIAMTGDPLECVIRISWAAHQRVLAACSRTGEAAHLAAVRVETGHARDHVLRLGLGVALLAAERRPRQGGGVVERADDWVNSCANCGAGCRCMMHSHVSCKDPTCLSTLYSPVGIHLVA